MKKLIPIITLCFSLNCYAAAPQSPPEKVNLCSTCHGAQGISVNPAWPNLAGQHADYLLTQLQAYKSGKTRNSPSANTMVAIVAGLSNEDMIALSEYYAKQPIASGKTPKKFLKRGEELYRGGDFDQQITACIACHGPRGTGNAQAGFPVLSGQNAVYTIEQLQAFKEGKRSNDLNGIMRSISKRMNPEDMEAVAYYVQGLH